MYLIGAPFAFGYALSVYRLTGFRVSAIVAMVVSGLEILAITGFIAADMAYRIMH